MKNLGSSLNDSIASDNLVDLLANASDVGLDALISSGALDGIPIFGTLRGTWKTVSDVRNYLYLRNIARFLQDLSTTSAEDQTRFINLLKDRGEIERFGENILLLLDRIDDIEKPSIVCMIMAALVRDEIQYEIAMRLSAIIGRCYAQDLSYLRTFKDGVQGQMFEIAESLYSAGLLSMAGLDGGISENPNSGGTVFVLNQYGKLLVKYGLPDVR